MHIFNIYKFIYILEYTIKLLSLILQFKNSKTIENRLKCYK